MLSLGDFFSCHVGAARSFGGLLVVIIALVLVFGSAVFCFHPWGVAWFFCWVIGVSEFVLGAVSDGAGRFPLLYTDMCLN